MLNKSSSHQRREYESLHERDQIDCRRRCVMLLENVRMRLRARKIVFALFVIFFVAPAVRAQASMPTAIAGRDPRAVSLTSLSLEAMGGANIWNTIHSADVQGISTRQGNADINNIHWVDTWLKGGQMRRTRVDQSGRMKTFTSDSTTLAESSGQGTNRLKNPKYDPLVQLLTHMPGAALSLSMSDRYELAVVESQKGDGLADCVEIQSARGNLMNGGIDVTICMDKRTHLPSHARLALANMVNPTQRLTEKIQYESFRSVQGVLVPTVVTVTDPVGQKVIYNFSVSILNPENPEITAPRGGR